MDQYDDVDVYGTFTPEEAQRLGIVALGEGDAVAGVSSTLNEDIEDGYGSIERVNVRREGNDVKL